MYISNNLKIKRKEILEIFQKGEYDVACFYEGPLINIFDCYEIPSNMKPYYNTDMLNFKNKELEKQYYENHMNGEELYEYCQKHGYKVKTLFTNVNVDMKMILYGIEYTYPPPVIRYDYKVSVIVPVYNETTELLKRSIDSLLNQTMQVQIVICDDCSTNISTIQTINDYAIKHNNIKLIRQKENVWVGKNRNVGIKHCDGEYIGFLDADDYVDVDFYQTLYEMSDDYDVIIGKRGIVNLNGNFTIKKRPHSLIMSSIIKNDFLKKTNIKFPTVRKNGEDSSFGKIIFRNTDSVKKCDVDTFYVYYKRKGSLSNYDEN